MYNQNTIVDPDRDPKLVAARVKYPDGTYKEFDVDSGCEGSELFRHATAGISYASGERRYFSLCFYDPVDGSRHWIPNHLQIRSKLSKCESRGRIGGKRLRQKLPWSFSLEVQFYPRSPSSLVDDVARQLLFMQLEQDVLTGKLTKTDNSCAFLGALLLQLRFGDAPCTMTEEYQDFTTPTKLDPHSVFGANLYQEIVEQHKRMRGTTIIDALNLFMDFCATLPRYGLHFFAAKDSNQQDVEIGLGTFGVKIFQNTALLKSLPMGKATICRPKWETSILYRDWSKLVIKMENGKEDRDEDAEHTYDVGNRSHHIHGFYLSHFFQAPE